MATGDKVKNKPTKIAPAVKKGANKIDAALALKAMAKEVEINKDLRKRVKQSVDSHKFAQGHKDSIEIKQESKSIDSSNVARIKKKTGTIENEQLKQETQKSVNIEIEKAKEDHRLTDGVASGSESFLAKVSNVSSRQSLIESQGSKHLDISMIKLDQRDISKKAAKRIKAKKNLSSDFVQALRNQTSVSNETQVHNSSTANNIHNKNHSKGESRG